MIQRNVDAKVVAGFGDEWTRFDQSALGDEECARIFNDYFAIFPWHALPKDAVGADFGCGSGRWAQAIRGRVGSLHCIDASPDALAVARRNLQAANNVKFHCASVEAAPIESASLDFGYSLGVLHHTPNPREALQACVRYLKPGAPFLVYLYYRFDNRPMWFRALWRTSDIVRRVVCRAPSPLRYALSQLLAVAVYWPLARLAALGRALGVNVDSLPLSYYADKSFYVMRTDALDRFGTRLEHRFTRSEITNAMVAAGLDRISFHSGPPYWCAVGFRTSSRGGPPAPTHLRCPSTKPN
jgi:SAM-dependent methyltransferase